MADYVVITALVLSVVSFIAYVAITLAGARAKLSKDAQEAAGAALQKAQAVSIGEITELVKALTDFAGGLSKMGPALTSLIASILFLAIAAFGGGDAPSGQKPGDAPKAEHHAAASR